MSWALLVVGAVSALLVLNAFRPVRRNVVLFLPSFIAASLTIELAWLQLVASIGAVAVLALLGALDGWPGWVGLALAALSWVALGVSLAWAWSSADAAEAALADLGLVDDPVARQRIRRTRNVTFARVGGRNLKLDVYAPAEPPPPGVRRPAILQIHGGAWVVGDKREQGLPLLKLLARHGWVGFNANYRLSPAATWPDHLVDVKRALAFIREHADEYDVDPGFVAVTGGSAGGHLAAMMALTQGDPAYQPGFEDADTSVQACVPFYAVYDFTNRAGTMPSQFHDWLLQPLVMKAFFDEEPERYRAASPIDNVRADAPPFFVIHGDLDTLAPVADARAFVDTLRAVSSEPVRYLELRGAQHAFDLFSSVRVRHVARAVERFLAAQWRRHLGPADLDPTDS